MGDRVLEETARAVAGVIRREDIFGRYGGEEFGLICRASRADGALRTAGRLRQAIAGTVVVVGSESVQITASFGIAVCHGGGISTSAALIAAADVAMYRAKDLGRNRVEIAGPAP